MKHLFNYLSIFSMFFLTNVIHATVTNIKNMEHYKKLLKEKPYLVVKISASTCPACNMVEAPFEKVSQNPNFSKVTFVTFDAHDPEIIKAENVQGIPTFLFVKNGETKSRIMGVSNPEKFEEFISEKIRTQLSV